MNITSKHIIKRLTQGIIDEGCYQSDDFKNFCREFRSFIKRELKKVGGTDYQQSNGHYYITGFFTLNNQVYYISLSDIRDGFNIYDVDLLIRTAKDYKDFTGGKNNYIPIKDDLFKYLTK